MSRFRIRIGWQTFGRTSFIFKSNILMMLKRKVYGQYILLIVIYGSETWNFTKKQSCKLRTMQRAHERLILNITWKEKKTSLWIRKKTGVRDIIDDINNSKCTWAGPIIRMEDNSWTTRLTKWTPRTHNRMRGRPKTRWRDDLDRFRAQWERPARDRRLRKAYV